MKQIGHARTISEGLAAVESWASTSQETWFRGHSSTNFKLLPSVFRQGPESAVEIDEAALYRDFIREFAGMRADHRSEVEWLTLMQHYLLPTRLLDWTANFLVALYFAVAERPDEDGVLHMLNPAHLWVDSSNVLTPLLVAQIDSDNWPNLCVRLAAASKQCLRGRVTLNGIDCEAIDSDPFAQVRLMAKPHEIRSLLCRQRTSPYRNGMTGDVADEVEQDVTRHLSTVIAFRPPKLNPRLIAQNGMFTFHGGKVLQGERAVPFKPLDEIYDEKTVTGLLIPAEAKPALKRELRHSGVYEASLFPEMEYRAREIRERRTARRSGPSSPD